MDGFSIISAGSHLPADIASAILPEAFLNFTWYSVQQMTVPGFEFTIHVSNIQVNWPGNYGYFDCVLYLYDKFYKNEKRDIEQIIVKTYNSK